MAQVQVEVDHVFEQVAADARAFITRALAEQPGPIVGFYAGEVADVLGVSPMDVVEWTKDLARRWWLEGQRFDSLPYLKTVARLHGDERYIEVELHRDDCHKPLWQALQLID